MPVSSGSHEEKHSEEEQARDAVSVRVRDWLMPMIRSCKAVYRQPVGEWNKMIVEGFQYSNRNRCKASEELASLARRSHDQEVVN